MENLDRIGPVLILLVTAGVVILADLIDRRERTPLLTAFAAAGLLLAAAYTGWLIARDRECTAFQDTVLLDQFTLFFYFFFIGVAGFVILASADYATVLLRDRAGEFIALTLAIAAGAMLMASANDLITLFVAIELTSISQYTLAGFVRDRRSSEAGLKYLLLGATSTAILLYGFALLYGLTGTTSISEIGVDAARATGDLRIGYLAAAVALAAGFGFKMAIVPFQMWAPDVYEGAPTPVAAYLSVASKAAGFAVLLRVFYTALDGAAIIEDWTNLFAVLAAVSMTVGNVMALRQRNIKRLLGYSTIAQAGTVLIGVAATLAAGKEFTLAASGVLFYLAAYAFTNLGAFFAIVAITTRTGNDDIAGLAGMWRRAPLMALALAFCLVSLTGLPPTAGFLAKLYVFNAAIEADLLWLVIVGVLNTAISAYYYLRIVREMFAPSEEEAAEQPSAERPVEAAHSVQALVSLAALGVLIFGIIPAPLL
ncbi:MAG: NADH-quinone oxidoreductase subunit N, partial [Dehalococcoidia bacterium]